LFYFEIFNFFVLKSLDPKKVEAKRVKREKIAAHMAKIRGLRTWKNARGKLLSQ
jgi:hypothetical protein